MPALSTGIFYGDILTVRPAWPSGRAGNPHRIDVVCDVLEVRVCPVWLKHAALVEQRVDQVGVVRQLGRQTRVDDLQYHP